MLDPGNVVLKATWWESLTAFLMHLESKGKVSVAKGEEGTLMIKRTEKEAAEVLKLKKKGFMERDREKESKRAQKEMRKAMERTQFYQGLEREKERDNTKKDEPKHETQEDENKIGSKSHEPLGAAIQERVKETGASEGMSISFSLKPRTESKDKTMPSVFGNSGAPRAMISSMIPARKPQSLDILLKQLKANQNGKK